MMPASRNRVRGDWLLYEDELDFFKKYLSLDSEMYLNGRSQFGNNETLTMHLLSFRPLLSEPSLKILKSVLPVSKS